MYFVSKQEKMEITECNGQYTSSLGRGCGIMDFHGVGVHMHDVIV